MRPGISRRTGGNGTAAKGVTKTGEVFCLECNEHIEPGATKCPSCESELSEEVMAFVCPRCKTVMGFGTSQCPKCNMKFKIKAVQQKPAEDEKLLVTLMEMDKPGEPKPGAPASPAAPTSTEGVAKLAVLRVSIEELVKNRSDLLRRMERRLEEEKTRLAQLMSMDGRSPTVEQVEAEVEALADEMADIAVLQTHMAGLSDEITKLINAFEVSAATRERGLAARSLRRKLDEKEREVAEFRAKEEELAKREEMVDRKIKAYAAKKKQLDETEDELKTRLAGLEAEKGELERLRFEAATAATPGERQTARADWAEEQKRLRHRLIELRSVVSPDSARIEGTVEQIADAEADLGGTISLLENEIRGLMTEKATLVGKMTEAEALDKDMKRLLKVLDDMLGQLPDAVIEEFRKTDDFALYERILDRFEI